VAASGGTKAILAALFANTGLAITKFIAFLLTGSSAMLAESVHSVADSSNQALLLYGGKRAKREETPRHPFGYSRARYYYAFLVAVVLFAVGGLYSLYESSHKFQHPEPITSWQWVPVTVLIVGIILESFSLRTAIVESNAVRGSQSWTNFVRRSRSPELPVILLEDIGALLGLVFALIGVSLTLITGNGIWDAVGTAAIGVLLVVISIVLGIETKSLLMGESATPEDVDKIEEALAEHGFEDVIGMRTMHLGPEDVLVVAKVAGEPDAKVSEMSARINAAEDAVREAVPTARLIYLEVDVRKKTSKKSRKKARK